MAIALAYRAPLVPAHGGMKKSVRLLQHTIGRYAMLNVKLLVCDTRKPVHAAANCSRVYNCEIAYRPLGVPSDCLINNIG
jgi:hypothetical protein